MSDSSILWRVEFKGAPAIELEFGTPASREEVRMLYPRAVKLTPVAVKPVELHPGRQVH